MATGKDDRRVRYTKKMLKESLIRLLQEKSIDKVTVRELCQIADLNRSTFYAHYADQYDLLAQLEGELLDEITAYLAKYNLKGGAATTAQLMKRIFDYIVANADLCKVLLGENGSPVFQKSIMAHVLRQSVHQWEDEERADEEMVEYVAIFGVSGSIGIVQKWLQTGMQKSPDEMAELMLTLVYHGMAAYLGKIQSS